MEPQGRVGRVIFVGAVHEAKPALDAVISHHSCEVVGVVTVSEAEGSRLAGAVDLGSVASAIGVSVLRTDDINDVGFVETLRALEPDLLVVVGWTRLIGPELLNVPRHGCVGFHASLLPRHRGRAPVNWSILLGEKVTGNTMMMLDPGTDTGDIVDQRSTIITEEDTCGSVYERIAHLGADMLLEHMPSLIVGEARRTRQATGVGDVLPKRTPEMGVIDWDCPARSVHDWIRALTLPYPGAFSELKGRRVMVWRSHAPGPLEPSGLPGLILDCSLGGVRVATRGGSVLISMMSARGEAPVPAAAWCSAHGVRAGDAFDAPPTDVALWARGEGPRPRTVTFSGERA